MAENVKETQQDRVARLAVGEPQRRKSWGGEDILVLSWVSKLWMFRKRRGLMGA